MSTHPACVRWNRLHRSLMYEYKKKCVSELRKAVIQYLGGSCNRCGFSDYRALQIDHVSGGGRKERREIGCYKIMKKILSGFHNNEYQLLCANCNAIKRIENKE